MLLHIWIGILASLIVTRIVKDLRERRKRPPLPPGPARYPIIGNLKHLPTASQPAWLFWLKYKEEYGPISSVNVLGEEVILLHDVRLAVELLEKRAAIHSSRPKQTFFDMSGWGNVLGALRSPERVRMTRKHLHQEIGSNNSVASFNEVQVTEVGRFLLRLLEKPQDLQQHIRKEAGAIVLKICYGYTIEPHGRDPLVDLADKAMEDFGTALLPLTWLVDLIPILKYLPSWTPGVSFINTAKVYGTRSSALSNVPYEFVKRQMKESPSASSSSSSFLSKILIRNVILPGSVEETIIKWSAASLYAGGADTTVVTIKTFFLAMALFPDIQRKAQEELDSVLCGVRLPQCQNREDLPYINSLLKEVLRWHPVAPMSVPHVSTQDDVCEGYFIPKGSSIIANLWAFTHDESVYPDPMSFKPERFLANDGHIPERDPHMIVFGFGRRVCPGRNIADSNVFLTIAQTLSVFNISKPMIDGKEQDIELRFLPGVISHPAPFDVTIQPRSEKHVELVKSLEQLYPWEKSHAEFLRGIPDLHI